MEPAHELEESISLFVILAGGACWDGTQNFRRYGERRW